MDTPKDSKPIGCTGIHIRLGRASVQMGDSILQPPDFSGFSFIQYFAAHINLVKQELPISLSKARKTPLSQKCKALRSQFCSIGTFAMSTATAVQF